METTMVHRPSCWRAAVRFTLASLLGLAAQTARAQIAPTPLGREQLLDNLAALRRREAADPSDARVAFQVGYILQHLAGIEETTKGDDDRGVARVRPSGRATDDLERLSRPESDLSGGGASSLLDAAEASYRRCIDLDPTDADALTNLGKILSDRWASIDPLEEEDGEDRRRRLFESAIEMYRRAAESDPSHLQSRINLGLMMHDVGRDDEAVRCYEEAILHDDRGSVPLRYNLAVSLSRLGEIERAARRYREVVRLDPRHLEARINLAALHHQFGSLDDAVGRYKEALRVLFDARRTTAFSDGGRGEEPSDDRDSSSLEPKFRLILNAASAPLGVINDPLQFPTVDPEACRDYVVGAAKSEEGGDETPIVLPESDIQCLVQEFLDRFDVGSSFESLVMILNNVGQALSQQGKIRSAMRHHQAAARLLRGKIWRERREDGTDVAVDDGGTISSLRRSLVRTSVLIFQRAKSGCYWSAWSWFRSLAHEIDRHELSAGMQPSLLPFDTLTLPVSPSWRKQVAIRHAQQFFRGQDVVVSPAPPLPEAEMGTGEAPKLRLGYLSHDFANHPTAHLAEGLFVNHQQATSLVKVAAYSYGKDDRSRVRESIMNCLAGHAEHGGRFFDLSRLGHEEAIQVVRDDGPHIVYDMQGFTLGSRPELTAARLAPIQVNYLVFPGTSGFVRAGSLQATAGVSTAAMDPPHPDPHSSAMGYILGDMDVLPVTSQRHYTEKFAILDRSYQVNHYSGHEAYNVDRGSIGWAALRKREGLNPSTSVVVFANFNKQDKLDPASFSAWMQIMARVPTSQLWLLRPSYDHDEGDVQENIYEAAARSGVDRERIVFAERVGKKLHLARVAAADLFLDTFLYGAHSTATDALWGGLPLLTVAGDSFASRVGMSLLRHLDIGLENILVASNQSEFVDVAVELALSEAREMEGPLSLIRSLILDTKGSTLFDTKGYTRSIEHMSNALWEAQQASGEKMHVILCSND